MQCEIFGRRPNRDLSVIQPTTIPLKLTINKLRRALAHQEEEEEEEEYWLKFTETILTKKKYHKAFKITKCYHELHIYAYP